MTGLQKLAAWAATFPDFPSRDKIQKKLEELMVEENKAGGEAKAGRCEAGRQPGRCTCGGVLKETEWCAQHREECQMPEFCAMQVFSVTGRCPERKTVRECIECGERI